jgi:hypothetical protein
MRTPPLSIVVAAATISVLARAPLLAAQSSRTGSMMVRLSTGRAAAHPVAVTLNLHYEM